MKKRIPSIVLTIICCCLLFISFKTVDASSKQYFYGQRIYSNLSDISLDKTAFVVNDEEVKYYQIENSKLSLEQIRQKEVSYEETIASLIENIVQYQEAERRGLIVSQEKAKEYAYEVKASLTQDSIIPGGEATLEYIKGTGLSLDDYFDQEILIDNYRKALEIGLLRTQIYNDVADKHVTGTLMEINDVFDKTYDQLKNDLVKQVKIVYAKDYKLTNTEDFIQIVQ